MLPNIVSSNSNAAKKKSNNNDVTTKMNTMTKKRRGFDSAGNLVDLNKRNSSSKEDDNNNNDDNNDNKSRQQKKSNIIHISNNTDQNLSKLAETSMNMFRKSNTKKQPKQQQQQPDNQKIENLSDNDNNNDNDGAVDLTTTNVISVVEHKKKDHNDDIYSSTSTSAKVDSNNNNNNNMCNDLKPDDELQFIMEIMSCRDLLIADSTGFSDPYIKVRLGNKFIHQTEHIEQTLNPIYTVETGSIFVFHCTKKELYDTDDGGLRLKLKDFDLIGSDDELGDVIITANELCNMRGDSIEYKITPPQNRIIENAGYITIRCCPATNEEMIQYRNKMLTKKTKFGLHAAKINAKAKKYNKALLSSTTTTKTDISSSTTTRSSSRSSTCSESSSTMADRSVTDKIFKSGKRRSHLTATNTNNGNNNNTSKKGKNVSFSETIPGFTNNVNIDDEDNDDSNSVDLDAVFGEGDDDDEEEEEKQNNKHNDSSKCGSSKNNSNNNSMFSMSFSASTNIEPQDLPGYMEPDDEIRFLMEIMSCRDLLIADATGASDPYIKVRMGSKFIHQTKHITQTLNPKYTMETGSIFAFYCTAKQLFNAGGLQLRIKDWNAMTLDEDLGNVHIPADVLCDMVGDVVEYPIDPPKKRILEKAGFISLWCRRASDVDWEKYGNKVRLNSKFGVRAQIKATVGAFGHGLATSSSSTTDQNVEENGLSIKQIEKESGGRKLCDEIKVKIEILNARGLLVADKTKATTTNPYVAMTKTNKVDTVIHQTKHIPKTLDPNWDADTHNSICCETFTVSEIFDCRGLLFIVKDWDMIGSHSSMGHIQVHPAILCEMSGEPIECTIKQPSKEFNKQKPGKLTIRISPATDEEMKNKQYKPTSKGKNIAERISANTGNKNITTTSSVNTDNPSGLLDNQIFVTNATSMTVTKREVEEEKEQGPPSPDPIIIKPVPSWYMSSSENTDCVISEAIIHGDGIRDTQKLIETALQEDPNICWLQLHDLELSESSDDIQLANALVTFGAKIEKLCLIDLVIMTRPEINPPLFETLAKSMPNLLDLEIRMKGIEKLPEPFFTTMLQSRNLESLVLWHCIFRPLNVEKLCNALQRNRTLSRLEVWCCETNDTDWDFGSMAAQVIKASGRKSAGKNAIQRLVLSHLWLTSNDIMKVKVALGANSTLRYLALLGVSDVTDDKLAMATSQILQDSKSLQSLKVTNQVLKSEDQLLSTYEAMYHHWMVGKPKLPLDREKSNRSFCRTMCSMLSEGMY